MSNTNQTAGSEQQQLLNAEAQRRVRRALQQIEEAQNKLNDACATLSSLCHANPQWKSTGMLADKVKAHWYRVRDALEGNARVRLDPLATETVLRNARPKIPAGSEHAVSA